MVDKRVVGFSRGLAIALVLAASAAVISSTPVGAPSTTVLSPNPTTAYTSSPNNSVVLTATVLSGSTGTGGVTFKDGTTVLPCSEGSEPRPQNASSQAVCTTTFSTEGIHALTANYEGDVNYLPSSGSANVFVQNHTISMATTYCNVGPISAAGRSDLAYTQTTPYPSVLFVGDDPARDLTGSVSTLNVRLNGFSAQNLGQVHMLLVAPDGSHAFDFWSNSGLSASPGTYVIQDGASQVPSNGSLSPGMYGPTANSLIDAFTPGPPLPAPQVPGSFSRAAPAGSTTFQTAFTGALAHGAWSLYLYDASGAGVTASIASSWCIDFTLATGQPTTTVVTSIPSQNAPLGSSVSFTATVSSTPTPNVGVVTFTEKGSPLPGAPNGGVANVSAGVATIATTGLSEGDHVITASYHDSTNTLNDSFGTVSLRVDKATSTPTLSGSTWSYCNTGAISIPAGAVAANNFGPASPNPSNITVTNLSSTISSVSITLNGFHVNSPVNLESLLVGPNGAAAPGGPQTFDFFSLAGGVNAFGPQNTTFSDSFGAVSAAAPPGANSGPASYGSTSYTASPFFTLPGVFQHATTQGQFTFNTGAKTYTSGGVYANTNPNGVWSLYFDQIIHDTGSGVNGGWCLNFIENPVTGTGTTSHVGPAPNNHMKLDGTGSVTFSLLNNGDANSNGSTGDPDGAHPLQVTGTLPSGLTLGTLPTGSPWSCFASTVTTGTCRSSNAIAAGSTYPLLTLPVNVAFNAPASATVSGFTFAGGGMTAGTFASDTITIDPAAVLSITKTHTGTFTQGQTATWNIQVTNAAATAAGATDGSTVTVTDALPTGYTLASFSGTGWSCNGNNTVTCTSTAVVAGAGGSFNLLTLTVNVPIDSPISVSNTAKVYGGGDIVHTNAATAASGSDNNITVIQVPATITPDTNTTPQSVFIGTNFGVPLSVTVKDAASAPIQGEGVTFLAPGSGASGTFTNTTNTITVNTDINGVATGGIFKANGTGGLYAVSATAITGSVPSATFNLTNTGTQFLTGFALNSPPLRNNFGGFVGMKLTVGTSPLSVPSLGRICVAGNNETHAVKFVDASGGGIDVPGGSVSINMAGCTPGQFKYVTLAAPITLQPGGFYYLVSQEILNGDQWYDHGAITTTSVATVTSSVYFQNGWNTFDGPNTAYVPTDFQYVALPPSSTPAFVLSYNLNNAPVRNNFDGFVGMKFTVKAAPLNVSSLGRVCVAGNSAIHAVKLVLASAGVDVPGGTASVNMAGCTAGQFVYATLASPITLQANTAYYVASQETNAGDQWYDHGKLTATSDAAVNNSVYSSLGTWIPIDGTNTSYVPPNFQYSLLGIPPGAVQVNVQTSIAGPSFTVDGTLYNTPQIFTWVSGSLHTIATTDPQSIATGSRYKWSTWSDAGTISHNVSPTTNISYTANFTKQFLLTTGVVPVSSGSVTPQPTSALGDGYYDNLTSVQLTAAAAPGNTFLNWSGDLTGIGNPQSVLMSAPRAATANFQGTGGTSGFVVTYNLNNRPLRNDFLGWAGMQLTVGGNPLLVSSLGRICIAGNAGTHTVKFVDAATGIDLPGGSASLNMAGCTPGQFRYTALASPITLAAGGSYYLASQEVSGGDQWFDFGTLTSTSVGAVKSSVYSYDGSSWIPFAGPNTSYIPPDFQYSIQPVAPNTAFVTNYNLNGRSTRNDFTGWVGMQLTVGASNITVNSLGRIFVAGNNGAHAIKLVLASNGTDVPGGSVSLSMAGGTAGQFSYASLGSPVTLLANTSYYLVSQEVAGGDKWFDYGTLTTTSAGSVNNAVYLNGATWVPVGGANTSYVPPNFK